MKDDMEEDKEEENKEEEDKEDGKEEDKGEEIKGEEENEEGSQEVVSKKYTKENIYTMVSLVLKYPSGGHGGETFWSWMMKIYGETLLDGRNSNGLRNRWRKMSKQHPKGLEEYKQELAETLPKELVDDVEKKINEATADIAKYELSNKAYITLFPGIPRPIESRESEKGIKKKKLEDNKSQEISKEEKKKDKKAKSLLQSAKNLIDISQLVSRQQVNISKLYEDTNYPEIQGKITLARNLVIIKDIKENTVVLKNLKELNPPEQLLSCKKIEPNLSEFFKNCNQVIAKANKKREWSELEDIVLKNPEMKDMLDHIVKTRGVEEVEKHRKALNQQ